MIELTAEQAAVVGYAAKPGAGQRVAVVMCAAGTGKTATMVGVAQALLGKGHALVHYAAFNRAAVEEARGRMPEGVQVRTLHSLALEALGVRVPVQRAGAGNNLARSVAVAARASSQQDWRVSKCFGNLVRATTTLRGMWR